jgi:arginine decarboxylase
MVQEEMRRHVPILIIDDELGMDCEGGRVLDEITCELEDLGFPVIWTRSVSEGALALQTHMDTGAVLVDWDLSPEEAFQNTPADLINDIRIRNLHIPLYLLTEHLDVRDIPLDIMEKVHGYIWKEEDTPRFIAGRIEQAVTGYLEYLLPPFFKRLTEYVGEYKYAWHTPGHSGGIAFMKSPAGKLFFDFFGENIFRADLCSSVPELGSVLEHKGVVLEGEKEAARIFGADRTYYVTNGTSTSNKIVFNACVTAGDIVLVDRNCHKSIIHSLILTGAIPVYVLPTRNAYGILGPVHSDELDPAYIRQQLAQHPRIHDPDAHIRMAVLTNTTYDGICYNVDHIKNRIGDMVDFILFDEAWMPHARFHHLFDHRCAMSSDGDKEGGPGIFATQSAHKLLASFSQASMIHVRDHHTLKGKGRIDHQRFNEAFMIHTSTSPQYAIIASLDVAARMMEGEAGRALMNDTIEESVIFRKKMLSIGEELKSCGDPDSKQWWFEVWQPDRISISGTGYSGPLQAVPFAEVENRILVNVPECWDLSQHGEWHGIENLPQGYVMLDPTKVSILTPGIGRGVSMQEWGIPAAIVTTWLRTRGIVVEKTNFYSFLVLFSMANTKGRSSTLIAALFEFRKLYERDAPLAEVFPDLCRRYPDIYAKLTLRQFCRDMHEILARGHVTTVQSDIYRNLPGQAMTPAEGYAEFVRGDIELVSLDQLTGRISGVLVVIYPPGIPIVNPGERYTEDMAVMIDFLKIFEENDNRFPGFEYEMQGIIKVQQNERIVYHVYCIRE